MLNNIAIHHSSLESDVLFKSQMPFWTRNVKLLAPISTDALKESDLMLSQLPNQGAQYEPEGFLFGNWEKN